MKDPYCYSFHFDNSRPLFVCPQCKRALVNTISHPDWNNSIDFISCRCTVCNCKFNVYPDDTFLITSDGKFFRTNSDDFFYEYEHD
ncbi:MAG: hypothetical protein ACXACY_25295 [Candidatus Hodarchaeales archaeon]|jgi:hypothetical protein